MNWRPRYQHGDLVWVNIGAGVFLEGYVMHYRYGATYEVAVAGQGLQKVQERAMSPRVPDEENEPGPE
jgi:hypothetical protein